MACEHMWKPVNGIPSLQCEKCGAVPIPEAHQAAAERFKTMFKPVPLSAAEQLPDPDPEYRVYTEEDKARFNYELSERSAAMKWIEHDNGVRHITGAPCVICGDHDWTKESPPVVAQEEDRDVGLVEERRQFNVRIQELETALAQVQQIVEEMEGERLLCRRDPQRVAAISYWLNKFRAALPKE